MVIREYQEVPKHLLAVDCIIFGYENNELKLLLFHRKIEPDKGKWSLVGGWVEEYESVEDAATRVLYKITGLKNLFMEQVEVFSNPKRDLGGRVVSVAFYALISIAEHDRQAVEKHGASWIALSKLPSLIFDHRQMLEAALTKLRLKSSYELVGRRLLPEKFTMKQLRNLYNAIFQREFDPGNFRKKVNSLKVLEKLSMKNTTESKKGAYYYRYKEETGEAFERIVKL